MNSYYELGVKLACEQMGLEKDAGKIPYSKPAMGNTWKLLKKEFEQLRRSGEDYSSNSLKSLKDHFKAMDSHIRKEDQVSRFALKHRFGKK